MLKLIQDISKTVSTISAIRGQKGKYRAIIKTRGGILTVKEFINTNPIAIIESYKKGAIQTIEFLAEGANYWIAVFARKGKNVMILDMDIMSELRVGHINSYFLDTNLYSQIQYGHVNAKTWNDKAFVENMTPEQVKEMVAKVCDDYNRWG